MEKLNKEPTEAFTTVFNDYHKGMRRVNIVITDSNGYEEKIGMTIGENIPWEEGVAIIYKANKNGTRINLAELEAGMPRLHIDDFNDPEKWEQYKLDVKNENN